MLDRADPEQLRSHRKVAGIAGESAHRLAERLAEQRAQQLAQERFDQWRRDEDARADAQRRLAEIQALEDDEYGAKAKERDRQQVETTLREREIAALRSQIHAEIARDVEVASLDRQKREMLAGLPATVQQDLWSQMHTPRPDGTYGIRDFQGLREAIWQAQEQEARRRWETEERPRLEREILAKHRLTQPRPDMPVGEVPAPLPDDMALLQAYADGDDVDPKRIAAILARY